VSHESLAWYDRQRAADMATQFVLHELCFIADAEGYIRRVKVEYIAERVRAAPSTVFRALNDLEAAGVFSRETRSTANGGKVATGRLHFNCDLLVLTKTERSRLDRAGVATSAACADASDEEDLEPAGGWGDEATGAGETASLRRTPESGLRQNESLESNRTPESGLPDSRIRSQVVQNPESGSPDSGVRSLYKDSIESNPKESLSSSAAVPSGAGEREAPSDFEKNLEEDWQAFKANYPWDNTMSRPAARRELAKFTRADRAKAARGAGIYAAKLKARGKLHTRDAVTWLRDREFDDIVAAERSVMTAEGTRSLGTFVIEGTDWWRAWDRHVRLKSGGMALDADPLGRVRGGIGSPVTIYPGDDPKLRGKRGWFRPTAYPPRSTGPPGEGTRATDEDEPRIDFD
jgi:hypothetical protein